ncbi:MULTISPECIES: branched-chain amino acid ABC transporter permease [unclassified Mesorhizobium]|uniref:branched-chain amino acid ABC transporter permease n=1 Tax=unclassified Mesorhizobium TaxID=325217 RepID=UPI00112AB7C6|nr:MULTISPECIES: branched-chain amino acid ABC transporter permease [unclassified Mesorhizobium]TPJ53129.1 branched-chain amino acid ABC transporter permease [Mesorhizobium sp. B2-6-4]TPM95855.1 branched-chain amino acid ABC transporter permease [Mesorhizobium sp. B2-1-5]
MIRPTFSQSAQAILLVVALLVPLGVGPYWTHVGAIAWYYALLAASWALLAGFAGQFSFAHVAFAALGGYASALFVGQIGMPVPLAILAAIALAVVAGALIGALVLRLSGPYLALFTLAISEIFRLVLVAEEDITRGMLGLPVPGLFSGRSDLPYYYFGLALVVLAVLGMNALLATRVGLFLRAIREDEGAARASGVDTTRYKILVFVVTSVIAAIAGIYYGHFIGILTPNMAILPEMGLVIAMAVIGGIESLPGAVVGAVVVFLLSETLRSYGEWRFVLMGLALILVQRFAQNGLYPMVENWARFRARPREQAPVPTATTEEPHAG